MDALNFTPAAPAATLPIAFRELQLPSRYKLYFGGRGSAKSTSFATVLIARAAERPIKVLCCREFMSSIRDSVHQLLADRVEALGVSDQFIIERASIRHRNGSEFVFSGLRYNATRIKSMENISIAWVEEAATISAYSLSILVPTIRAPNSELWFSWNPELESDPIWDFVKNPRPDSVIRHVTYADNPFFPEVLRREMRDLKERDYDAYTHVYQGKPRQTLVGAIYAQQLRDAVEAGRIGNVPYDPLKGVHVAVDLGFMDRTSMWLFQTVQREIRLIDFIEGAQEPIGTYLKRLQERSYVYDTIHLPPDARAKELGTGKSVEEIIRAAGFRVQIVRSLTVEDGINAVRTQFPNLWFDETRCADGINHLRRYRYEVDDNGAFSSRPTHDESSHACLTADAVVWAERGHIPIADVVVGDRVWTPAGFADVTHAGPVKQVRVLVEITLADGRSIRCTPEHKILSNRGFVHADALRCSDRVFRGDEWPLRLIALYSRVASIGFRAAITGATSGARRGRPTFIARFGRAITVRFRKAMMSITSTATLSIIPSTIWNASTRPSTNGSTHWGSELPEYSKTRANLPFDELRSGTDRPLASNGTGSMARSSGNTSGGSTLLASSAVRRFARLFLHAPSGATPIARLSLNDYAPPGETWVYDLTCGNHGCYQANGVLVSNSDALRYAVIAMTEKRTALYGSLEPPGFPNDPSGTSWMSR